MINAHCFIEDMRDFGFHVVANGGRETIICNGQVSIGIRDDGKKARVIFDGGSISFLYDSDDADFWEYVIMDNGSSIMISFGHNHMTFWKDGNLPLNLYHKEAYKRLMEVKK